MAVALAAVALSACTEIESIYRTVDLNKNGGGPSVITDAQQRIITNVDIVNESVPGQVLPKRIVCAEPSPDVAVAFSKAIQLGIAASNGGVGGSASLGASTAQSIAQLGERLASIQLLRDMAYRNCEAYANGSINATSYTILNSRLNKTIVTLLSSEMTAGAFGCNLAVVLASSKSESKADTKAPAAGQPQGGGGGAAAPPPAGDTTTSGKTEAKGEAPGTGVLGQIVGRQAQTSSEVAGKLAQIHRQFMEDNSFVTLMDACVAHLNTIPVTIEDVEETPNSDNQKGNAKKTITDSDKTGEEGDRKKLSNLGVKAESSNGKSTSGAGQTTTDQTRTGKNDDQKNASKSKKLPLDAIERAKALIADKSPFSTICVGTILPKAVEIAGSESMEKFDLRKLQISAEYLRTIAKVVDTCRDDKAKDTPGCKNLDKLLAAVKGS